MMDHKKTAEEIIVWIQEKVRESGTKGCVFGLSGGIDSSLVAVLCKKAFPDNVLGLVMPCNSSSEDEKDAISLAEYFNIPYKVVSLGKVNEALVEAIEPGVTKEENRLAYANVKPRLRMTALYFEGALRNYLVVGTGNKSEIVIGYFTKYGDGGVDIEPIGELVKTEVKELSAYLGIQDYLVQREPTAGLWGGQTDEKEMGFTYEQLDKYILTGIADDETKNKIEILRKKSEHKKKMPPVCSLNRVFFVD